MKRIVIFVVGCIMIIGNSKNGEAQQLVNLFYPYSWEDASMKAARENKLLMVEVTPSGEPIHSAVEKKWLKNTGLMNFLNKNVVAIRMDMSTPEGKEFEPRLLMYPYPAYAFFMPYGDLLGILNPADALADPLKLREIVENAMKIADVKRRNSRSIHFSDKPLPDILAQALKNDKSVFLQVIAPDCQACLLMEKNVFNLDKVADFYNANFLNLQINIASDRNVVNQYQITNFPAFLFLNAAGKVIFQTEGYRTAEQLIQDGEQALEKAKGITFLDLSQQEALQRARETGKMIFIDAYADADPAHKEVTSYVFTDPDVTRLFDRHFISIAQETKIPAYIFMNADGEEIHRVSALQQADDLLRHARMALENKGLSSLDMQYRNGDRSPVFVESYIDMLAQAGRMADAGKVTVEYLASMDNDCLKNKKYWDLFYRYANVPEDVLFEYVLTHRHELYALYDEKKVRRKIEEIWVAGAENFVKEGTFDEVGFKLYVKQLRKQKVEGWRNIVRNARMNIAEKTGDWKTYVELAEEKWTEEKISDAELYSWGVKINKECHDEATRFKAARWFAWAASEIQRKEIQSGKVNLTSYKGFFEKLVDDLVGKK